MEPKLVALVGWAPGAVICEGGRGHQPQTNHLPIIVILSLLALLSLLSLLSYHCCHRYFIVIVICKGGKVTNPDQSFTNQYSYHRHSDVTVTWLSLYCYFIGPSIKVLSGNCSSCTHLSNWVPDLFHSSCVCLWTVIRTLNRKCLKTVVWVGSVKTFNPVFPSSDAARAKLAENLG